MKFNERQEQREADRPEIKNGFIIIDKDTYGSLPLTRWLDKSKKPIDGHPELLTEHKETKLLGRQSRMPVEFLLKSKLVRETLKKKKFMT